MSITVNIYYTGTGGAARAFAEEMTASGTVEAIRTEQGNLRYEYFSRSTTRRRCCSLTAGQTRRPSTLTMHRR